MKIFKPLKPRIKKSDLINENTRLHDRLKSLEADKKTLLLAKETYFNSILVRLKDITLKILGKVAEFQFHFGATESFTGHQ